MNNYCNNSYNRQQRHTHEFLGSTKIAEREEDPHNHKFAGVTGQAIPSGDRNHFHIVEDKTGPAIPLDDGRHVHFVKGHTTLNDGHKHEFIFATLIENPIGD